MAYTFTRRINHNTHSDCKTHALVKTVAQLSKNTWYWPRFCYRLAILWLTVCPRLHEFFVKPHRHCWIHQPWSISPIVFTATQTRGHQKPHPILARFAKMEFRLHEASSGRHHRTAVWQQQSRPCRSHQCFQFGNALWWLHRLDSARAHRFAHFLVRPHQIRPQTAGRLCVSHRFDGRFFGQTPQFIFWRPRLRNLFALRLGFGAHFSQPFRWPQAGVVVRPRMETTPLPHPLRHLCFGRLRHCQPRFRAFSRFETHRRHRMHAWTRRHLIHAQRLVALDAICWLRFFSVAARLGQIVAHQSAIAVEFNRTAPIW